MSDGNKNVDAKLSRERRLGEVGTEFITRRLGKASPGRRYLNRNWKK